MPDYTWDDLNRLLDAAGGAVYIARMDLFRDNLHRFRDAFRQHYANTQLGYSYKTNYLPAFCIEADRLGLYAEVVSGMEYQIALACGVPHERILFNGPVKSDSELTTALTHGAQVNVDSLEEADRIVQACRERPEQTFTVGLRIHFHLSDKKKSRFGLGEEEGQVKLAFEQLNQLPNCEVNGLHCHFSFERSADSYRQRTERMLDLVEKYFPNQPPKFIDLGGGFYSPMPPALQAQLGAAPSYEDYAEQIAPLVARRLGAGAETELILEPGIGVVGNVLQFACRVESIKQLAGRRLAVTTGSYQNIKPGITRFNLPLEIYRSGDPEITDQETDLVGYTCMEDDTVYYGYAGSVVVGDIVVLDNVGAYSLVFKPPFIRPMPGVVMRERSGEPWQLLRTPQTVSELLTGYALDKPLGTL